MRVPILMFLTLLLGSCLDLSQALFFKALKALKGGGRSYGGYSSGYGRGYGGYSSGYGGGYASNYGYNGGYGGYGGYGGGYGYAQQYYTPRYRQPARKGRTYSDIARVGRADPYLGLGAGRYLPRAPYSHLWG